jgi:hypothetical protein
MGQKDVQESAAPDPLKQVSDMQRNIEMSEISSMVQR